MAALGKIRSKGTFLIIIIGLGLFGFIAGDMFRSCESTGRERSNRVGEILGEKIGAQDYQAYVEEFVECTKITAPQANDDQLRSMAWNSFLQNKILENEANKLGITVTIDELNDVMKQGTHNVLMEMANVTGFVNQQTGRFDFNAYQKFISEYKTQRNANPQLAEQYDKIHKFVLFKERQLREQLLAEKYQTLLAACVLSNPIEAKFNFDASNQESDIELAYFDFKSVNDKDVKITEDDLKNKYNEKKEMFRIPEEIRSIKYILVKKVASAADRAKLNSDLTKFAEQLRGGASPETVVRESRSNVAYLGVPVKKTAFSNDIASRLDSVAVGGVLGPVESTVDNTLNVIKVIAKNTLPDSVEYRAIYVQGKNNEETKTKADSVYNAVVGGGDFEAIAKKYAQNGAKNWMTTAQYERATSMSKDDATFINTLNNLGVNETKNLPLAQGNVIIQVTNRKNMVDKYDVAVVKRDITYSDETSHATSDKFKQFVAANQSLEAMEKNAKKAGYDILEAKNVLTSQGSIPGITNSRDALKWVFEADKNDVSEVITCGANRDEMVVMVLTDIYPKGYMPLENSEIKEYVQNEVLKDKKSKMLLEKLNGVKSVAEAKAKGAQTTEVTQITFASPSFVSALQAREPALSGAVAATEKGKFSARPVVGNAGVYVFQVKDRRTLDGKFDAKESATRTAQSYMQSLRSMMQELYINANVVDNRYLFF